MPRQVGQFWAEESAHARAPCERARDFFCLCCWPFTGPGQRKSAAEEGRTLFAKLQVLQSKLQSVPSQRMCGMPGRPQEGQLLADLSRGLSSGIHRRPNGTMVQKSGDLPLIDVLRLDTPECVN
jgi:hypothetical protein